MWRTADGSPLHLFPKGTGVNELCRAFARDRGLEGEDGAFFVCWTDALVEAMAEWHRELPDVRPFYAVKCNPDPVLLRLMASLGAGFDCASAQEIRSVLELEGVGPERVLYANPCKTRSHLRSAAALGVQTLTFDNREELLKIAAVHPTARLLLRLAVTDESAVCQLGQKFGCEPGDKAEELLAAAAGLGLRVAGLSFHVGSGCRDPSAFQEGIRRSAELVRLGRDLGLDMGLVDIGGGFPGSGTEGEGLTFGDVAQVVRRGMASELASLGVSVVAEPGRFFATRAFSLVCNIIAKTSDKDTDVSHLYINDGVYGSFNCKLFDHAEPAGRALWLTEAEAAAAGPAGQTKVWGPTCDGLDLVLDDARLPDLDEGDWLLFPDMGAYTSAAATHFNGFPPPSTFYAASADAAQALGAAPALDSALGRLGLHDDSSPYDSTDTSPSDAP